MIFTDFLSFRARWAKLAVPPVAVQVDFLAPNKITRLTDEWNVGSNPFYPVLEPGMKLVMVGSASGNDVFTIGSFSTDFLMLTEESTVVTEAGVTLTTIEGKFFDKDGHETWPVEYVRVGDTAVAFDSSLAVEYTLPELAALGPFKNNPFNGSSVRFSATAGVVADSVFGVDEYDWYLSQRTDDPTKQYLAMSQEPSDSSSYSGTVQIVPTTLATTKFGFTTAPGDPIDPSTTRILFRSVDLYVRRISDQAIQRLNLLNTYLGL